jgi:hypothetical protein
MDRRKTFAILVVVLMFAIVVPVSVQKAHADDASEQLTTSGYVIRSYSDSFLGRTVDAVQAGSVMTFTLVFAANSVVYQRNVSMGVKFDWMNNYQNSSIANPQNTYSIYANQIATITLNYTIPNLTGQYSGLNLVPHSWVLEVWNGAANSVWTAGCGFDNAFFVPGTACRSFGSGNPLAIYSNVQATGVLDSQQANAELTSLKSSLSSVLSTPPGATNAIALMAQANAQITSGNLAYQTANFNAAETDYQNALNTANAAQSSLATTGGGTDTATLSSIWIESVAILLAGIGAVLVGTAGFKYLRARSKLISGATYTPVGAPKP